MSTSADLLFAFHRGDSDDEYEVEALNTDSNNPGGVALKGETTRKCAIDRKLLREVGADPAAYGRVLRDALFRDKDLLDLFTAACSGAERLDCPLHFRLRLTSKVARLHGLRWETILDPRGDTPLAVNQRVLFSRYIDSPQYRRLRARRPDQPLKAVVAAAAPDDLGAYERRWGRLAPVRVPDEQGRAAQALGPLNPKFLTGPGEATLDNLAALAAEGCDVLYLACHGVLDGTDPKLFLVDDGNNAAVTSGDALVERLRRWNAQPFVVVLASCQSAGGDEQARLNEYGVLAALGPKLAAAGVPAVVAMQGNVTVETVDAVAPVFFTALLAGGSVDAAMATAREKAYTRNRPDYWMPVLFSRVPTGQLWYTPGLAPDDGAGRVRAGSDKEFKFWDGLLANIAHGECTPVLGFGLLESVIGPRESIAGQWAERYGYPLARAERTDLSRVAQFLAADQMSAAAAGYQFARSVRSKVLDRLPDGDSSDSDSRGLHELLARAAALRDPKLANPFAVLAGLPFRAYLSTTPDRLLEDALRANDPPKDPQVQFFPWWDENPPPPAPVVLELPTPGQPPRRLQSTIGRPPENRPLVYRLFGDLDEPETLVLTDDNHFDYLTAMSRATARAGYIPAVISGTLARSAVVFLGFRATEWDFRLLMRSIRPMLAVQPPYRYTNVAVVSDPAQVYWVGDERVARRNLEKHLGATGTDVSIYWGRAEDFLAELLARWTAREDRGR